MHHHPRGTTADPRISRARRAWHAPRVERIRAGDAENTGLNNTTDGSFTFAS